MMNEPKFEKLPSVGGGPVIAVIGSVPSGPAAGDPEMVVPMGDNGDPASQPGVDINGGAYDDFDLIGVAYVIEQGTEQQPAQTGGRRSTRRPTAAPTPRRPSRSPRAATATPTTSR